MVDGRWSMVDTRPAAASHRGGRARRTNDELARVAAGHDMRRIIIPWGTIHCFRNIGNAQFVPRTGWIKVGDIKKIQVGYEKAASESDATLHFAFQLAQDEGAAPTTSITKGGAKTGNGMVYGNIEDISGDIDNNLLIRFGFRAYNETTDNTLVCCAAGGHVVIMAC